MTASTSAPDQGKVLSLTAGQLPRFTAPGLLVVSLAVAAGILALGQASGIAGTIALGTLLFLVSIFVLSASVEGGRRAKDRLARYVVTMFFILALLPLASLLWSTVSAGLARFDTEFFSSSMYGVVGHGGGVVHAIWGTLIVTGLATLVSVPVGLLTAIYLVEYGEDGKLAQTIRFFVDVMTGIPSIVAGLFAYTVFAQIFTPDTKAGMVGAAALTVLMIPTVVRSTEEMLRLVPKDLREASYALGVPKWRTILKVVLPTSIAGIITGVVLAIARIIGETAPLLVTAGFTGAMNLNAFTSPQGTTHSPMMTLPVFVYYQYTQPGVPAQAGIDRAWAGALTLILIVMALNLLGRLIAWKFAPKPGR